MRLNAVIPDPWNRPRAWLLGRVIDRSLRRDVAGVHVRGTVDIPSDRVVALVANHSGRYDGFVLWSQRFTSRSTGRHMTVMLQRQMDKYRIFNGAGAVGLVPGSMASVRDMVRTVHTWSTPGDTLALFPQGRIYPGDKMPLAFQSLVRVLGHINAPVDVIPTALATEMLDGRKPSIFVSFGEAVSLDCLDPKGSDTEDLVAGQVRALRGLLNTLGEDAPTEYEHA